MSGEPQNPYKDVFNTLNINVGPRSWDSWWAVIEKEGLDVARALTHNKPELLVEKIKNIIYQCDGTTYRKMLALTEHDPALFRSACDLSADVTILSLTEKREVMTAYKIETLLRTPDFSDLRRLHFNTVSFLTDITMLCRKCDSATYALILAAAKPHPDVLKAVINLNFKDSLFIADKEQKRGQMENLLLDMARNGGMPATAPRMTSPPPPANDATGARTSALSSARVSRPVKHA